MDVLIDETSSPKVAAALRAIGIIANRVGDQQPYPSGVTAPALRSSDREIVEFVHQNMTVLITFNQPERDRQLREALSEINACAVIVKPAVRTRPMLTALLVCWDEMQTIFDAITASSPRAILVLDSSRHRLERYTVLDEAPA